MIVGFRDLCRFSVFYNSEKDRLLLPTANRTRRRSFVSTARYVMDRRQTAARSITMQKCPSLREGPFKMQTEAAIQNQITNGGNGMPPFRNQVDAA